MSYALTSNSSNPLTDILQKVVMVIEKVSPKQNDNNAAAQRRPLTASEAESDLKSFIASTKKLKD